MSSSHKYVAFQWDDPLLPKQQLTGEERMVCDAARSYCQDRLMPRMLEAFCTEHTNPAIFCGMGLLGLLRSLPTRNCRPAA